MATLRKFLNSQCFNWETGIIVHQPMKPVEERDWCSNAPDAQTKKTS
jgi:hypothetical protein